MSLSLVLDYSDPSQFVFDNTKLTVSGGVAALILAALSGSFSQSFGSSTGFTFNSTASEFVGGVLRQKDTRPANETFFAPLSSIVDGAWGNGVLTGTLSGSTAFVGGKLNLTGGSATWAAAGNADSAQTGCVRFRVTPNYSGSPSAYQVFVAEAPASGIDDFDEIFHAPDGSFHIFLSGTTGTIIVDANLGAWSPVAGTEYEIELDYDLTTGATRLFIDGVQFGATQTQTGSRSAPLDLYLGRDTATYASNFKIRNLEIFSTVQHTANYSVPSALPNSTIYIADTVTFPTQSYSGAGTIQAFTAFTATDANTPHYTVNGKYWNGSAWVASNGSYAQSNPVAVINTNIGVFVASGSVIVQVIWQASNIQMSVSAESLGYTGQAYSVSNPSIQPTGPFSAFGKLMEFIESSTITGSDAVGWILQVSGIGYYWNGSTWATSNGTYAESSNAATISANLSTFPAVTAGAPILPIAFLHSNDGTTTPELSSLEIDYTFNPAPPATPHECQVFGFLTDIEGNPIGTAENAMLIVTNATGFFYGEEFIGAGTFSIPANSQGYVNAPLIETATHQKQYGFSISYRDAGSRKKITYSLGNLTVPDLVYAPLSSLVP